MIKMANHHSYRNVIFRQSERYVYVPYLYNYALVMHINPSGAMPFSVLRKAMGWYKLPPPLVKSYFRRRSAPIYFSPFCILQMRKIATKSRCPSHIPLAYCSDHLKLYPVDQNSVAKLDFHV